MAETRLHSQTQQYIESTPNPWWSIDDRLQALEQARTFPVPSRLGEDWRHTDPESFPWDRVEQVERGRTVSAVDCSSISNPEAGEDADVARSLQVIAGDDYDAKFLYYHRALSAAPVFVRIPRGSSPGFMEITQRFSGPGAAAPNTVIVVEPQAELTLLERWEFRDEDALVIGRTEIIVQEGARLKYLQEDVGHGRSSLYRRARIHLARDAKAGWYFFTEGAAWHVARLDLSLEASGAEGTIRGLFAGCNDARADHRTHQYHAAPHCRSDLLFKTLLSGRAHSVYQGLISVPAPAQKTDAYQQCRNLLLEPGTHADAIPKLEIIADDVRCTHGASMGSLNKDHLFYLQSRGLSREQAARTISMGFAEEVVAAVPEPSVQERWRSEIVDRVNKFKD